MTWIRTFTGLPFDPFNINHNNIVIEDIAHALSNQCRFSGHTSKFYSVAQHSVLVMRGVQGQGLPLKYQLKALMHDASEAYLVDMPTPIKRVMDFYRDIEHKVTTEIEKKFNIPSEPNLDREIKFNDLRALATEARDLMGNPQDWEVLKDVPCYETQIIPLSPSAAKELFLHCYHDLAMWIKTTEGS